ncbi:hypothetical protein J3E68DRAFT_415174 [Trichoderma sp. SZMC 28012]
MFGLGKLGLVHAVGYSAFATPARHTALAETLFLQRFLSLAQPGACLVFFLPLLLALHCIAFDVCDSGARNCEFRPCSYGDFILLILLGFANGGCFAVWVGH